LHSVPSVGHGEPIVGRGEGHSAVAGTQYQYGPPGGGLPSSESLHRQVPCENEQMRSSAMPGASEAGHLGMPDDSEE
jgi:hypothetical protein